MWICETVLQQRLRIGHLRHTVPCGPVYRPAKRASPVIQRVSTSASHHSGSQAKCCPQSIPSLVELRNVRFWVSTDLCVSVDGLASGRRTCTSVYDSAVPRLHGPAIPHEGGGWRGAPELPFSNSWTAEVWSVSARADQLALLLLRKSRPSGSWVARRATDSLSVALGGIPEIVADY